MRRSNQVLQETNSREDRINKKLQELRDLVTFCQQFYLEDHIPRPLSKFIDKRGCPLPTNVKSITALVAYFTTDDIYMEMSRNKLSSSYAIFDKETKQQLIKMGTVNGQISIIEDNTLDKEIVPTQILLNENVKKPKSNNFNNLIHENDVELDRTSINNHLFMHPDTIDLTLSEDNYHLMPLNQLRKETVAASTAVSAAPFGFFNIQVNRQDQEQLELKRSIAQREIDHKLYKGNGKLAAIFPDTIVYVIPHQGNHCYPTQYPHTEKTKGIYPIGDYYIDEAVAILEVTNENEKNVVPYTSLKLDKLDQNNSNLKIISEEDKPNNLVQVYKAGILPRNINRNKI